MHQNIIFTMTVDMVRSTSPAKIIFILFEKFQTPEAGQLVRCSGWKVLR